MSSRDVTVPAAFLRYARFNDQHDADRITAFRAKLAGEVQTVTGSPFEIFQDTRDIRVGQQWKTRIEETLDSATLLIAILTPSFFKSEYCRKETAQFLEREARLGRSDLIIPVYYVGMRAFEKNEHDPDELVEVMKSRQSFDWTRLRFAEPDSTELLRAVNALALQIQEALENFAELAVPVNPAASRPAAPGQDINAPSNSRPPAPAEQ